VFPSFWASHWYTQHLTPIINSDFNDVKFGSSVPAAVGHSGSHGGSGSGSSLAAAMDEVALPSALDAGPVSPDGPAPPSRSLTSSRTVFASPASTGPVPPPTSPSANGTYT
jgi:hypothetical protein